MEQPKRAAEFCHVILPAPNLDKAKSFYETVFGWSVSANVPGTNYWFFNSGNVGGAFDASRNASDRGAVLVIKVEDMQSVLDLVREHGGSVTRGRSRIGEAAAGYDAYFSDPNGNEMGLFSKD
jgi:uncharacterized protein